MNTIQDDKNRTVNDELLEGAVALENMAEATKETTEELKASLNEAKSKYEATKAGVGTDDMVKTPPVTPVVPVVPTL